MNQRQLAPPTALADHILVVGGGSSEGRTATLRKGRGFRVTSSDGRALARIRIHLRRALRFQELLRESRVDSLTQVLNRRGILVLERELAKGQRSASPVSIAIADVDNFKRINDQCGHTVGDCAFRRVARALSSRLDRGQTVGRLGGDEFLVVAPGAGESARVDLEGRLGAAMPVVSRPEMTLSVAISIGSATARAGEQLDALINRADKAMFREKRRAQTGAPTGSASQMIEAARHRRIFDGRVDNRS